MFHWVRNRFLFENKLIFYSFNTTVFILASRINCSNLKIILNEILERLHLGWMLFLEYSYSFKLIICKWVYYYLLNVSAEYSFSNCSMELFLSGRKIPGTLRAIEGLAAFLTSLYLKSFLCAALQGAVLVMSHFCLLHH